MKRSPIARKTPMRRYTLAYEPIPCPVCGKAFIPYGGQKTCSMKCKLAKGDVRRLRNCKQCGKSFEAFRPAAMTRFCSRACSDKAAFQPREFKCTHCGKAFLRGGMGGRTRRFCSKECQFKGCRGENNSLWRGDRRMERGTTWREARDAARKRDQRCLATGCMWSKMTAMEKLSVDHIVPFRLAKQYLPVDQVDPNHLDNLACLCRRHHSAKTRIEARLLRGDILGFRSAMNVLMPIEIVDRALALWHLGVREHAGLKPEAL